MTVKSVGWTGNQAIEVIFEVVGRLDRKLVFRDDERQLEIVIAGRSWSFEGLLIKELLLRGDLDADPSYPNTRFPIAPADVNRAIDVIEALGGAIHGAM